MNIRWESLKQTPSINFERNNILPQKDDNERSEDQIKQHVAVYELETLLCLESLVVTCYQTLGWLVHNRTIRKECLQFEQHAQYHQEELRKIFKLYQKSEVTIESKVNQYLLRLKPSYLSLSEIINVIINFTAFKIDLYKYFSRTVQGHQRLLNNFLQDNIEEMYFLDQEKNFHKNRVNTYLNV